MKSATINGRVIAVTGGAQGIGKEIVRQLAERGAFVAIGDFNTAKAAETVAELRGEVVAFELDVTSTESYDAFLAEVEAKWGPLDVLVNNAGVMWVGKFDEEPESWTQRQLDINLHGVLRGVKLVGPKMRARRAGHIVTVASAASKLPTPGEATYSATKHGVYGYLKTLKEELRGSSVELSIVMPTVVDTELAKGTSSGAATMLQPADVAQAVVDVIERPRFEVMLPRYVNPVIRVVNVLPEMVRDLVFRRLVPNQVTSTDNASREEYQSRSDD
ncbi:SDR family oxidoreductase [Rhodococcus sp. NPDC058521]|uniref:SDR family oxidoreductase n=1 Tax=Rhodococcus sp. NPDC058521 TaxID=3346536 RepID=UPI00364FCF6A